MNKEKFPRAGLCYVLLPVFVVPFFAISFVPGCQSEGIQSKSKVNIRIIIMYMYARLLCDVCAMCISHLSSVGSDDNQSVLMKM